MLHIITTQLSEILPKDHKLKKYLSIDPRDFNKMFKLFKSKPNEGLCVYDTTSSKKLKNGKTIMVKDHLNNTGKNILTNKQKKLNIDFIDMTNIYTYNQNSITATCCGKKLSINLEYPCHYLCHITTLARAMKLKIIKGYLYNKITGTNDDSHM